MIAESSKAFILQEFAVKFYFGLSLHIFQHGSLLSLENVCDYWCMHQTGFSSAAVMPQSECTELCSSASVLSQSKFTSCVARQPLCHNLNLPRCEAQRRHLTMTCDIFGTGQTNTLTLCSLLGKTCKSAHGSVTLESLKSARSTKLLEKCLVRRPLCHKVNLPSCVARRPFCHKVNLRVV